MASHSTRSGQGRTAGAEEEPRGAYPMDRVVRWACRRLRVTDPGRAAAGQRWALLSPNPRKRRTTGMKKGTEESYVEDLASHDGPAHALAFREGAAKRWCRGARRPAIAASKWARLGCRRAVDQRKATSVAAFSRAVIEPRGVEEPGHARDLFMLRTGRSHGHPPVVMEGRVVRGTPTAVIP